MDGEQYTVVDVSGAPDGAWIRQRIFAKVGNISKTVKNLLNCSLLIDQLSVHEHTRAEFSIYPSEVGSYALGSALSDRRLLALCRDCGDPSGSLKLFVSTSPDRPSSALDSGFPRERFSVSVEIHSFLRIDLLKGHNKGNRS
jgi:hypothetical protein